jgi:hypothetical protein
MSEQGCVHIDAITTVKHPKRRECQECVKIGASWVHLRTCQECGGITVATIPPTAMRRNTPVRPEPTKELISIRVDRDVVRAFRATGRGWQTKANEALRAYAKKAGLTRKVSSARPRRKTRTTSNARHA